METFCLWVASISQAILLIYLLCKYRFVTHKEARFTAMILALIAHRNDVDKVGAEYKWHLDRVVRNVKGEPAKIVAWLHDICEDGHLTHKELRKMGVFTNSELFALKLLDKTCFDGFGYSTGYQISSDKEWGRFAVMVDKETPDIARRVKIADLKDNLDATRFTKAGKEITEKDRERFMKYESQLSYLEDV